MMLYQPSIDTVVVQPIKSTRAALLLPFFLSSVSCGFPSPAADWTDGPLDLTSHLVQHPAATFVVRAAGDSMQPSIWPGDLLMVDRAVEPHSGTIVLGVLDGEFLIKRLRRGRSGRLWLVADNSAYTPIEVCPDTNFEVWAVVTHIIHRA